MTDCPACQHERLKQMRTCPQCGASFCVKKEVCTWWGFEYKSKWNIAGLPLLHIAFKYKPNKLPVVAKGVIAIGQFGYGVVCISQFGLGLISISQFTVAGFALAQFGVAYSLIAQMGMYINTGYGQHVINLFKWFSGL